MSDEAMKLGGFVITLCAGLAGWTLITGRVEGAMKFWAIILIVQYVIYIVVRLYLRRAEKALRGE